MRQRIPVPLEAFQDVASVDSAMPLARSPRNAGQFASTETPAARIATITNRLNRSAGGQEDLKTDTKKASTGRSRFGDVWDE